MYHRTLLSLMNLFILLLTSDSVSIDSFFCGLILSLKNKAKFKPILTIALTVFCLCFLGSNFGFLSSTLLKKYSNLIGGLILCFLSFKQTPSIQDNFFSIMQNNQTSPFFDSFLIGISIGVDGLIGCISLTLIGFNYILVTLIITSVHVLLLISAFNLSSLIVIKNKLLFELIPSITLLTLGITKLLTI